MGFVFDTGFGNYYNIQPLLKVVFQNNICNPFPNSKLIYAFRSDGKYSYLYTSKIYSTDNTSVENYINSLPEINLSDFELLDAIKQARFIFFNQEKNYDNMKYIENLAVPTTTTLSPTTTSGTSPQATTTADTSPQNTTEMPL